MDFDFEVLEEKFDKWYLWFLFDIVIVIGFIVSILDNIFIMLKWDGSDLLVVIMGVFLKVFKVIIWIDVDGVYSVDLRKGNVFVVCMLC